MNLDALAGANWALAQKARENHGQLLTLLLGNPLGEDLPEFLVRAHAVARARDALAAAIAQASAGGHPAARVAAQRRALHDELARARADAERRARLADPPNAAAPADPLQAWGGFSGAAHAAGLARALAYLDAILAGDGAADAGLLDRDPPATNPSH